MVKTAAEKDSTGELDDLLERLEVSDDDGFELPCGRRIRLMPSAQEIEKLYLAGSRALKTCGIDEYRASDTRKRTRPGGRCMSTWETLFRQWKKRKAEEVNPEEVVDEMEL